MDDRLMNAIISQMARQMVAQQLFQELKTPSCDICDKRYISNVLKTCDFCKKVFCPNCCGKDGTVICKICNWALAQAITYPVLDKFCVKELKVISDNYKISLHGISEKRDLIEAILKEFKKSIEGGNKPGVNVDYLRQKMITMKTEDDDAKTIKLQKEAERAKIFENIDRMKPKKKDLCINFSHIDHVEVVVEDIPGMKIKDIKCILDSYKVDYSFAIEKKELVDLAVNLTETYNEYRARNPKVVHPTPTFKKGENKAVAKEVPKVDLKEDLDRKFECVVCMANQINSVFLKCAHSTCCYDCGLEMKTCPLCRGDIEQCIKIYFG